MYRSVPLNISMVIFLSFTISVGPAVPFYCEKSSIDFLPKYWHDLIAKKYVNMTLMLRH